MRAPPVTKTIAMHHDNRHYLPERGPSAIVRRRRPFCSLQPIVCSETHTVRVWKSQWHRWCRIHDGAIQHHECAGYHSRARPCAPLEPRPPPSNSRAPRRACMARVCCKRATSFCNNMPARTTAQRPMARNVLVVGSRLSNSSRQDAH